MQSGFESFSTLHFSTLFVFGIITFIAIHKGRRADHETKVSIALVLAGLTFSSLILEAIVKFADGTYDILTDLPLFLCDLVTVMLPLIVFTKNRKWTGILYFWALAGTLQALITPELDYTFPSFHFFRYFVMHAGIVATVLYTVLVWKIRITWKDFLNAIIYAQIYLVLIHVINHLLGSNYSYTIQKPQSASILDAFGPWPWYIIGGELMMILLFFILIIPFLSGMSTRKEDPIWSNDSFEDG
jgi:hypothetical integral membrane protein (TIGR02206 family)